MDTPDAPGLRELGAPSLLGLEQLLVVSCGNWVDRIGKRFAGVFKD